jgi:hypothetical protein
LNRLAFVYADENSLSSLSGKSQVNISEDKSQRPFKLAAFDDIVKKVKT